MTTKQFTSVLIQLIFTLTVCFISSTLGDIRCHCNLPKCVQTGYMCKSIGESAACYSSVDGISEISRHGCIELLPLHMKDICYRQQQQQQQQQQEHQQQQQEHQQQHHHHNHNHHNHHNHQHNNSNNHTPNRNLRCCSEDMCNYVRTNDNTIKAENRNTESQNGSVTPTSTLPNLLWFRIAVIVVPIAGSLVLIILILLAAKVLRQDTKRQRQSVEVRKQRQFKTNLLLNGNSSTKRYHYNHRIHTTHQIKSNEIKSNEIKSNEIKCNEIKCNEMKFQNNLPEKNETNAKMNDLRKECDSFLASSNDNKLYSKNINLAFSKESNLNESTNLNIDENLNKDDHFEKPTIKSLYSSLLSFGQWDTNTNANTNNKDKDIV